MWPSGLTLAMTLTLNFQGQIWNFLYLSQKWSDCHGMKSKHIDSTPVLKYDQLFDFGPNLDLWILKVKCDLDLWPHIYPWPWIFMVKFWNSCTSESEGRLTLHKGGGSRPFTYHDHDHLVTKVRCMDLPDSDRGDFSCRRAVDSSSFFNDLSLY